MCSSSEFSVKSLVASGCPSVSSHISRAHAISCNSTGCVITCGFTSFGGLRSTLPNQVKLSYTVQWQSDTLVWGIPWGTHGGCVSTAIIVFIVFVSGDCLDVAQPCNTAQFCSAPALISTMLRWTFQHHWIDSARWL